MKENNLKSNLNALFEKNREIILYLIFGGCAFIISVGSFIILTVFIRLNELIANIISWILAVCFAFLTNRNWVFQKKTATIRETGRQFVDFISSRILTLIIEEAIILIFITQMGLNSIAVKIIAQIIVIVLNYLLSKNFVFR